MIIQSIRLKNIKSYGSGDHGQGVTVTFHPGINRIAGRNGYGKSTLIEAIGYALFLAEPEFEENFQTERYFLSHGEKAGEIDVTFLHNGTSYRVECGIGSQSKRKHKVIQVSDGSSCAEGNAEVANFLGSLFSFGDPKRLGEMFIKLVGVRQGRLTWPFDSKSAEAKRFFEPLLDVAIYKECFDRLKPVVDEFEGQEHDLDTQRAVLAQKIQDRADSGGLVVELRRTISETETRLQEALKERDAAQEGKKAQELLEREATTSKSEAERCDILWRGKKSERETAQRAVDASVRAAEVVQANAAAHTGYEQATNRLASLEQQRAKRDQLQKERGVTDLERERSGGAALAAREQVTSHESTKQQQQASLTELRARLEPIQRSLAKGKAAFDRASEAAGLADSRINLVGGFVGGLEGLRASQEQRLVSIRSRDAGLAGYDANPLNIATTAEKEALDALTKAREVLSAARGHLRILQEQHRQLSSGICPFLKEQCRQFDPAKVQEDITACIRQIEDYGQLEKAADRNHQAARAELNRLTKIHTQKQSDAEELRLETGKFVQQARITVQPPVLAAVGWLGDWEVGMGTMPVQPPGSTGEESVEAVVAMHSAFVSHVDSVSGWWERSRELCRKRLGDFQASQVERQGHVKESQTLEQQVRDIDQQTVQTQKQIDHHAAVAIRQESLRSSAAARIVELDGLLSPFANLATELEQTQAEQKAHRPGHEAYIGAKGVAQELERRKESLGQIQGEEVKALETLDAAKKRATAALAAFDPEKLRAVVAECREKDAAVVGHKFRLENEKKTLKEQESRLEEWKIACQRLERVDHELGRCRAAIELTEAARVCLRRSAPAVAQHICTRIARQAQQLFNQINPEPISLEWDSENYSLRVDPGDRRFAMLSGGEQTKLALAMILAMLREFSNLGLCIFDEPTYGVDAASRRKLAETIIQLQTMAGLEQLLLVSHDDAFEGMIEHSIVLDKSAAGGSSILQQ